MTQAHLLSGTKHRFLPSFSFTRQLGLLLIGFLVTALPGCDSGNEPAPDSSPDQSEQKQNEGEDQGTHPVVELNNVYLINGEVVPIDPSDDDPEPYSAESFELFDFDHEVLEYQPGLRSPVRCESCVCSQGTCICEGCEVEGR